MTTRRASFTVFFTAAALLLLLHGNRFVLTNDEGILLEPARAIAHGSRPYADFFGYMSPGSYWIQAALFRVLGVSYWVGRVPVIIDLSAQCAFIFWLVSKLASRNAAVATALLFFGFQIADPSFLTAQHRWDSGTLALAGIGLALRGKTKLHASGSGALCAAAAWCTPSALYVLAVVGAWLALSRERRDSALPFIGGAAVISTLAAGYLTAQGAFLPFLHQMQWLQKNYSQVNFMPYGSVPGGYGALLQGAAGAELAVRALVVFCLALPAILPIAAVLLCAAAWKKLPELTLLLPAMLALTATSFPRADMMHLAFVAALPYALTGILLTRLLPRKTGAILFFAIFPLAGLFTLNNVLGWWNSQTLASPAGALRVPSAMTGQMRALLTAVRPGQTMFVYPYMPVQYFVTRAHNASRYPYLQPGLMTARDAATALKELQARPPQWLLYLPLSQKEFLRVFPNAKSLDWHFEELESWMMQNYAADPERPLDVGGYRLMKWTGKASVSHFLPPLHSK